MATLSPPQEQAAANSINFANPKPKAKAKPLDRARNEGRGTIMCASVFPLTHKNIEGVFDRNVSSDTLYKRVLKRMVATVAVSDEDPL